MRPQACKKLHESDARGMPGARVQKGSDDPPPSLVLLESAVRRLNERGLALLTKAAQSGDEVEGPASWKQILPLWARASEVTIARAARCPMVLLDFNFQRVRWWSRAINSQPPEGSRHPRWSAFHAGEALPLARELLLEAWSAARSLSHVSSLVFGMAPEVTTLIARLSPCDVESVVIHKFQEMRPRWENRPMFWKELFYAARKMDDRNLANVHLHCLQLLGGELVSTQGRPSIAVDAAKGPPIKAPVDER